MKKILAALLAGAMALSLVACSGGDKSSTPTPPANNGGSSAGTSTTPPSTSGDKIPVNVIAAEYGQNTKKWWADFQTEFNASHDDIDLTVEVISWNDISTVVTTRITGNAAPDILNIDLFAAYQDEGLLLPAKDYVSDETYAKLYPAFLEQSVVDGTVWAIPDLASARAMYYNKDILEAAGVEVPTTWDELKAEIGRAHV